MSISQIVSLCVIGGAFTLFAVVLAWGEHQTHNLKSFTREAVQQAEPGAGFLTLKNVQAKAGKDRAADRSPQNDKTARGIYAQG